MKPLGFSCETVEILVLLSKTKKLQQEGKWVKWGQIELSSSEGV